MKCITAEKKAVTPSEASNIYGLNEGTLANLRCHRQGPKYYKVGNGRKVIYFVEDLEAWLQEQPVLTTKSFFAGRRIYYHGK